jgi:hypothetical protein
MECETITERAVLLERVAREARRREKAVMRPVSYWLEVPCGAPAYSHLYGGSAVYMAVPMDNRLVTLGHAWARADAQEEDRRESGKESLRAVAAWARTLERIAGLASPDPRGSDDLAKRLARAEAGVVDLRDRIARGIETCKGGALEKALIRMRLDRLSPGPEDRAAVIEVFKHDIDTVGAAARKTRWPIVLDEGKDGTHRIVELCERIDGRIAFGVLQLRAWEDGTLYGVTTGEERLYCFQDKTGPRGFRSFYADILSHSRTCPPWDSVEGPVEFMNARGAADTVPAGMELDAIRLSPENVRHWIEGLPSYWKAQAPVWAAPFLFDEFRDAFPPECSNLKGETDPERR